MEETRRPHEADEGTMANAYDMHSNTTNARTTARLRIAINEQDMISLSRMADEGSYTNAEIMMKAWQPYVSMDVVGEERPRWRTIPDAAMRAGTIRWSQFIRRSQEDGRWRTGRLKTRSWHHSRWRCSRRPIGLGERRVHTYPCNHQNHEDGFDQLHRSTT